jgi:hypothetical protein
MPASNDYNWIKYMSGRRNDRKVMDLITGQSLEQNKMLKLLFDRSRLKRNDWHKAAELLAGRSLGSPTKLSDIFKGKDRSLPMRDITPYIQALRLNKSNTDYYISEFFKAYCDENLHQFITKKNGGKESVILNLRILLLEEQLETCQHDLFRNRYVDLPIEVQTESRLRIKERDSYKAALNRANELLTKTSKILAEHSLEDSVLSEELLVGNINEGPLIEQEMYWEEEHVHIEIESERFLLTMESYSREKINQCVKWYLLIKLILNNTDNNELMELLRLFIPEQALTEITLLKTKDFKDFTNLPALPNFRTKDEMTMQLFDEFKALHPKEFNEEMKIKMEPESAMPEEPLTFNFLDLEAGYLEEPAEPAEKIGFNSYLENKTKYLSDIPRELKNVIEIIKYSSCNKAYENYIKFMSLGISNRVDVGKLYYLQNPFIDKESLKNTVVLTEATEILSKYIEDILPNCDMENPLKRFNNKGDEQYHLLDLAHLFD